MKNQIIAIVNEVPQILTNRTEAYWFQKSNPDAKVWVVNASETQPLCAWDAHTPVTKVLAMFWGNDHEPKTITIPAKDGVVTGEMILAHAPEWAEDVSLGFDVIDPDQDLGTIDLPLSEIK